MKDVMMIGAGRHGLKVVYPSTELAGGNIVAVSTRHYDHAYKVVKRYNPDGLAYDDYQKMLKEVDCDHVVICLQAEDALEVVKQCIQAKKNVFVEKPCGMDADTAYKIYQLAQMYQVKVHVGFMKRYADTYVKLKKIIEDKTYGKAISFTSTFYVDARMFCKDDHSFIYYVAIHMLDLYRFLFNDIHLIKVIKSSIGDGTSYHCLFENHQGVIGSANFENRSAHTQECEGVQVTFENGYVVSNNIESLRTHQSKTMDNGFHTLSEVYTSYEVNYSPASGYEKDLYLRGFVGEMEAYLKDMSDYSMDNYKTNLLCDELLMQLTNN
ncbi:MAG: Gfo/Idh/MocA family oxidoreductase [Erysipelotrichaceae bacterium]